MLSIVLDQIENFLNESLKFLFVFVCFYYILVLDIFVYFGIYVRFLIFVHFLGFSSIEKGKSFEILCCAVPIACYIDLIFEK